MTIGHDQVHGYIGRVHRHSRLRGRRHWRVGLQIERDIAAVLCQGEVWRVALVRERYDSFLTSLVETCRGEDRLERELRAGAVRREDVGCLLRDQIAAIEFKE